MKKQLTTTALLMAIFFTTNAQTDFERKGFVFGAAVGFSSVKLSGAGISDRYQVGISAPNMKLGTMISPRTALFLVLPGSVYSQKWDGRKRDRGFEGIVPSVQFWATDRFWLLGGAGLGMDAPAFYDIKDASERKFYFGGAALAGAGFEFWRRGKMALDLQGRMHFGNVKKDDGRLKGIAFSLSVGCNFY